MFFHEFLDRLKLGAREGTGTLILLYVKDIKNVFSKILKIPTTYSYLVNPLKEEFHRLYKPYLNQDLIIIGIWKEDDP